MILNPNHLVKLQMENILESIIYKAMAKFEAFLQSFSWGVYVISDIYGPKSQIKFRITDPYIHKSIQWFQNSHFTFKKQKYWLQ